MSLFNSAFGRLLDGLLFPLRGLPAEVGIVLWSLVTAVAMLLVVKRTSNQAALAEVKRRIHAGLFEIRLFNDDLPAMLRAQLQILRHNGRYLLLSLPPLVVMIVPFGILVAHLQGFYGYRPVAPGEEVLVRAAVAPAGSARPVLALEVPDGLSVATPAVWAPALHEVAWRLVAERPGRYELRFSVDGHPFTKSLTVGDAVVRLSPRRPSSRLLDQLTWPAEPPLPAAGPLEAIAVDYPPRDLLLAGRSEYAWLVVFLVLSMALAFALKKPLKVTI
jgi:hypothetical protein